jgi:DNA-binding MarR family transcriptional regulator
MDVMLAPETVGLALHRRGRPRNEYQMRTPTCEFLGDLGPQAFGRSGHQRCHAPVVEHGISLLHAGRDRIRIMLRDSKHNGSSVEIKAGTLWSMARSMLEVAVVAVDSVVMQANNRLEAALSEHGLTRTTAQALWAIDPDGAPPSMKTIAQRLFCNAPNLTFVMNQLTDKGLVVRAVDPVDRRSRVVELTRQGRRVRSAIIEAALAANPLANLDEADTRELVRLLSKALARRH